MHPSLSKRAMWFVNLLISRALFRVIRDHVPVAWHLGDLRRSDACDPHDGVRLQHVPLLAVLGPVRDLGRDCLQLVIPSRVPRFRPHSKRLDTARLARVLMPRCVTAPSVALSWRNQRAITTWQSHFPIGERSCGANENASALQAVRSHVARRACDKGGGWPEANRRGRPARAQRGAASLAGVLETQAKYSQRDVSRQSLDRLQGRASVSCGRPHGASNLASGRPATAYEARYAGESAPHPRHNMRMPPDTGAQNAHPPWESDHLRKRCRPAARNLTLLARPRGMTPHSSAQPSRRNQTSPRCARRCIV